MRRHLGQQCVTLIMVVVLLVSTTVAESRGAMLQASGAAVNGVSTTLSSAIFSGDVIKTGASTGTLTSPGNSVVLGGSSNLRYEGGAVTLFHGTAVVKTTKRMAGSFQGLKITPVNSSARFLMDNSKGTAIVAALEGPLEISDGARRMVLASGKMMMTEDPPRTKDPQSPSDQESSEKKQPGGVKVPGIPGWKIAVVSAAALGGVLGGLAATGVIGGNGQPTSPTH